MRITLLGAPGSGAQSLARRLSESMKLPLLPLDHATGTDGQSLAVIRQQLDASDSFLLTGFPATLPQAQALDQMLAWQGSPVDLAIMLGLERDIPTSGARQEIHLQESGISEEDQRAAAEKKFVRLTRYYKTQNKLLFINTVGDTDADLNQLKNALETRMRHMSDILT